MATETYIFSTAISCNSLDNKSSLSKFLYNATYWFPNPQMISCELYHTVSGGSGLQPGLISIPWCVTKLHSLSQIRENAVTWVGRSRGSFTLTLVLCVKHVKLHKKKNPEMQLG